MATLVNLWQTGWCIFSLVWGGLLHFFCSTGFESGGPGFAHVNQNCMQIGRQIVSTLQAQCSKIQSSHFETFEIFIGEPQEIVMKSGRMKSRWIQPKSSISGSSSTSFTPSKECRIPTLPSNSLMEHVFHFPSKPDVNVARNIILGQACGVPMSCISSSGLNET